MIIVIPARGGSKRIPNKNLALLNGKSLLARTIECALEAGLDAPIYVSSEDEAIISAAKEYPVNIRIRPQEFAQDTSSTEDALIDVLDTLDPQTQPKWIMTLPVTSPFRRPQTIKNCAALAHKALETEDCIMTVNETRADFWRYDDSGRLTRLFPDAPRRQQDRKPLFEENGVVYLSRVSVLRKHKSVLGAGSIVPTPITYPEYFDINTPEDLRLAQAIMSADPA